jgi:DNA modification methylase
VNGIVREFRTDDLWLIQGDSAEVLSNFTDGMHDCCVTDPPYGIGEAAKDNASRSCLAQSKDYGRRQWDNAPATKALVDECRRVSEWQVLFGGNYFELPPAKCWLVWDKLNGETDFADCELAWTNLNKAVRKIAFRWHGMLRDEPGERVHPTQKPIRVMQWAIAHCHDNATVIDPFAGSFTTAIACIRMGKKFVGIEREPTYFDAGVERVKAELSRTSLLEPAPKIIQRTLLD